MNKIIFTEFFDEYCQKEFQITRSSVRNAVSEPDSKQIETWASLNMAFFIKRERKAKGTTYLFVYGFIEQGDLYVRAAYRFHSELIKDAGTLEPLPLLEYFVTRFGYFLSIYGEPEKEIKFLVKKQVETKTNDWIQLIRVQNVHEPGISELWNRVEATPFGNTIFIALAYTINVEEYKKWLFSKIDKNIEPIIIIADIFQGYFTLIDFLQSAGTFEFRSNFIHPLIVFAGIDGFGYFFELGYTGDILYIQRNDYRVEVDISNSRSEAEKFAYFLTWSPIRISINIYDTETAQIETSETKTPTTFPPMALIKYAMEEILTKSITYSGQAQFNEVVISAIQAIQDKVKDTDCADAFWNTSGKSRKPKSEPKIHPTIHGFLRDVQLLRNLEIVREAATGAGLLDFLLMGSLESGKIAKICVEFKHAHSKKLIDGLLKQLPAYMRAKECEYGVYCVLWFKEENFSQPTKYNSPHELDIDLEKILKKTANPGKIRILILDLSHPIPPSKL